MPQWWAPKLTVEWALVEGPESLGGGREAKSAVVEEEGCRVEAPAAGGQAAVEAVLFFGGEQYFFGGQAPAVGEEVGSE